MGERLHDSDARVRAMGKQMIMKCSTCRWWHRESDESVGVCDLKTLGDEAEAVARAMAEEGERFNLDVLKFAVLTVAGFVCDRWAKGTSDE